MTTTYNAYRTLTRVKLFFVLILLFSGTCYADEETNILSGKYFLGERASGNVEELLKDGLVPEGTEWLASENIVSNKEDFYIAFDLSSRHQISALLIQADHNDTYFVESSEDGLSWIRLWTVPPVYAGTGLPEMGIRTRTTVLANPQNARYLRLRGEKSYGSDGRFSIARVKAYSLVPGNWPPELDYSIPNSKPPRLPMVDMRVDRILKIAFTSFMLALMTWILYMRKRAIYCNKRRICKWMLLAVIILSAIAWPRYLQFNFGTFYHIHDFFHYYMGPKYIKELGYVSLYECTAVAEVEDGRIDDVVSRKIRDLSTNKVISTKKVMLEKEKCLSQFDNIKWEEFKNDVRLFRGHTKNIREWNKIHNDHGFNGTPVWIILGKLFAGAYEPSSGYISFLSFLDLIFILAAGMIVYRSFGLEATFVTASYFFLNNISSYGWTGGSFLRYDWFLMLVLGIAALKNNRGKVAGFALTYSALLRLFPAIVLIGIALKALTDLLKEKSFGVLRGYRDIAIGFVIAIVLLMPLSIAVSGKKTWGEFVNNTMAMSATIKKEVGNIFGLGKMVDQTARALDIGESKKVRPDHSREYQDRAERYKIVFRAVITAAFFILFIAAILKEKDLWVVAVLSLGLVPFGANLMNYYYIILTLFGLLWLRKPMVGFGLVMLSMASWIIGIGSHASPVKFILLQVLILLFVFAVTAAFAKRQLESDDLAGESSS
jgi:hypothetical protein